MDNFFQAATNSRAVLRPLGGSIVTNKEVGVLFGITQQSLALYKATKFLI